LASQNPRIECPEIRCVAGNDGRLAAYRAVEHVYAFSARHPQQISRRRIAYAIYRQRNGCFASLGCNPFSEIRSIDEHDVAPIALISGDHIIAPYDIDGLETQRFRDRNQRRPTPELALFCIIQDPDGNVTKSCNIRYAVVD